MHFTFVFLLLIFLAPAAKSAQIFTTYNAVGSDNVPYQIKAWYNENVQVGTVNFLGTPGPILAGTLLTACG
jgi:hypothetical protein